MNNAPILILQMQRMGDLVLSFPLLGWLAARYPGHPVWVVGEQAFYEPLMPLSPSAVYFSYDLAPNLKQMPMHLVINLSHRPKAAALAGKARSDALFGPYLDSDGHLRIKGDWQLYRTSLTDNNYYNRYHWADLNALDVIPLSCMQHTAWPELKKSGTVDSSAARRIGLFLGASQPEKHPDASFWVLLTRQLLAEGYKPVLLGGKAEIPLGYAVAKQLNMHPLNLCGRFSVHELAQFINGLDLFISPDTGPMHIAAWLGVPVLNVSLGPVNPWETGPFALGHHVLRAAISCSGCWTCSRERQICRELLTPAKVTVAVNAILRQESDARLARRLPGLELLRCGRDADGLYTMETLLRSEGESDRQATVDRTALSRFWQVWFGTRFGIFNSDLLGEAHRDLSRAHPDTAEKVALAAAAFALDVAKNYTHGCGAPDDFWRTADPVLHPFSGWAQMVLQNAEASRHAVGDILNLAGSLAEM